MNIKISIHVVRLMLIAFTGTSFTYGQVIKGSSGTGRQDRKKTNIVYVFADQWRAQATGYAGDPNVKTPNIPWRSKRLRENKLYRK